MLAATVGALTASSAGADVRTGMLVFDASLNVDSECDGCTPGTDTLKSGTFAVGPGGRRARSIVRERPAWKAGRTFSPDGRWITYTTDRGEVFFRAASGRTPARRVPGIATSELFGVASPAPSNSGLIAFTVYPLSGPEKVFVIRHDGRGLRPVTPGRFRGWSPSGWITVLTDRSSSRAAVSIVRPDGTGLRQVAHPRMDEITDVTWSPSGRRLALTGNLDEPNLSGEPEPAPRFGLWTVDVASGRHRFVTTRARAEIMWSPDGRTIAFTEDAPGGGWDIYEIRTSGRPVRKLAETSTLFHNANRPGAYVALTSSLEWPPIDR